MTTITTPSEVVKPISSKAELKRLEDIVHAGSKAFLDTGRALIEIRERKGYQLRGFETFEEYCEQTFGFSVREGQRLINDARTVKALQAALPEAGKKAVPANAHVARQLAPVAESPKAIQRVAARLEKEGKSIATATATEVKKAVDAIVARKAGPTNGASTPEEPPKANKPTVRLPAMNDACPHCGQTPERYLRPLKEDRNWHCGNCDQPVLIGVIALAPAACPACGAAVIGETGFCNVCGALLKEATS